MLIAAPNPTLSKHHYILAPGQTKLSDNTFNEVILADIAEHSLNLFITLLFHINIFVHKKSCLSYGSDQ